MSTSSQYVKNKLKQVIENGTQHFIIKSYLTSKFEYDRKIPLYHIYWFNANKGVCEDFPIYKCMSNKRMNRKELRYFFDIIREYDQKIDSIDGSIWEHKEIGFDKDKVRNRQTMMDLFNPGS